MERVNKNSYYLGENLWTFRIVKKWTMDLGDTKEDPRNMHDNLSNRSTYLAKRLQPFISSLVLGKGSSNVVRICILCNEDVVKCVRFNLHIKMNVCKFDALTQMKTTIRAS